MLTGDRAFLKRIVLNNNENSKEKIILFLLYHHIGMYSGRSAESCGIFTEGVDLQSSKKATKAVSGMKEEG
jgi:hypothetical protein